MDKKEQVWIIIDKLRPYIGHYGFIGNVLQLLFFKYLSSYSELERIEDFKVFTEYKDMFIKCEFNKDITLKAYKIIEEKYKIENSILQKSLYELTKLFEDNEKELFTTLNGFELPKDKEEMKELIITLISNNNNDVSKFDLYSTNLSLSKLVNKILDVKEDETYLDCFSGYNLTALQINAKKYLGYELNIPSCAISNMIMIMIGKDNFNIKNEDSYRSNYYNIADKVFSDGPLGLKLDFPELENKKADYYNIVKPLEALKENGLAVVTTPSSTLYNYQYLSLRKELILNNLIAVISLPSLWNGTIIFTNLLVLTKHKKNEEVIMIEASGSEHFNKLTKNGKNIELKNETINKILNSLDGEVIEGFSKLVKKEDLLKDEELLLMPSLYVKKTNKKEYRSSLEVKKDLLESIEELKELLN